jgi:hypothetical protein
VTSGAGTTSKPRSKSSKKSNGTSDWKKTKKTQDSSKGTDAVATSADLLDFDLFDGMIPNTTNSTTQDAFDMLSNDLQPTAAATASNMSLSTSNSLLSFKGNDHFQHLATFSTTSITDAVVPSADVVSSAPKSGTGGKRPWLNATVKADGANTPLLLSLCYKVYVAAKGKSSSPLPAASILFRLSNNGNVSLRRVSLSFISSLQQQDVKMSENIAPGESVEMPCKIDPFSYSNDASSGEYVSMDIKGHIMFSAENHVTMNVPFKVVLPCCICCF